jgi:hypothetical protein
LLKKILKKNVYLYEFFLIILGQQLANYHEFITDHKEVLRTSMSLQGAMLVLKDDIFKVGNVSVILIIIIEFKDIHLLM